MRKFIITLFTLFILATMSFAAPKEKLIEIILAEYDKCMTVAIYTAMPVPNTFKVPEMESLSIENDILTIEMKNMKDKSRVYRKALDNLSLVWIKKDKKKEEFKMIIAISEKMQEASDTAMMLNETLTAEFENANNQISLIGLSKLPIIFNKTKGKVEKFEIDENSILNIMFDNEKSSAWVYASATEITQVSVKKDHKKSLTNLIAIFK